MENTKGIFIDPFSFCSCFIKMFCNNHLIGGATGSFWRHLDKIYLVTNWHVLSGREPSSGQPKNKDGAIPDVLSIYGASSVSPMQNFTLTIPLYDGGGSPLWRQHPLYGQTSDIAIVEVLQFCATRLSRRKAMRQIPCINDQQNADMRSTIAMDVFVIGFPLNVMKTGVFPIWKRASIATEFEFDIDNIPSFLIDTATREGMSGAPVIQRDYGTCFLESGGVALGPGIYSKFLGIYSGRHVGGIGEAQLGVVWKATLISEIISNPGEGDFVLRSVTT